MAEAVRTFKFISTEDVPESLSERFGFDENDHLVNINEKGEATQARKLGHAIVEMGLKGGLIEEEAPPQTPPEVALLLRRLDEIESQMDKMMAFIEGKSSDPDEISPAMQAKIDAMIEEKIRPLNDRINELETENKTLRDEKEQLEKELAEARGETGGTKKVGGFGIGDKVALLVNDSAEDEEYETGYKVARFDKKDDKDVIVIKNETDEEQTVEPGQLASADELDLDDDDEETAVHSAPAPAVPRTSNSRFRRGWNTVTGRIGNAMTGYQVRAHNGFYNLVDRRGNVVREDVEVVDGYDVESERRGAAVVGGVALLGAGILVGWLLFGRHGNHEATKTITETVTTGNGGGSTTKEVILNRPGGSLHDAVINRGGVPSVNLASPVDHLSGSGWHRDYFPGLNEHKAFGVDLPKGYNMVPNGGGRYDIVGPNLHIRNVEWNSAGQLAKWVRRGLEENNISFKTRHNLNYYDNVGPGRHGWINHYVTAIGPNR